MVNNEILQLIDENDLADWVYINDTVGGLIEVGEKGKNLQKYYIGHRKILTFKEYIIALKKALNSESELCFGVYQEKLGYDYSKLDLDKLYRDTGFECRYDFNESINNTKDWLIKEGMIK